MCELLVFADPKATVVWNYEIVGQLSDGLYENYRRGNRRFWTYASTGERDMCSPVLGDWNYSINTIYRELCKVNIHNRVAAYINCVDYLLDRENMIIDDFVCECVFDLCVKVRESTCEYREIVDNVVEMIEYDRTHSPNEFIVEMFNDSLTKSHMTVRQLVETIFTRENVSDQYNRRQFKDILSYIDDVVRNGWENWID